MSKEEFYKYGESLGIKINDLQRLKMLADACNDNKYTAEDMLNASKYGYEFRDTTSFPEHKFEDGCINNTKQWLQWYNESKIKMVCPNCNNTENFHINYDYTDVNLPIEDILCNECGTFFK
jgi:hypothetical protein